MTAHFSRKLQQEWHRSTDVGVHAEAPCQTLPQGLAGNGRAMLFLMDLQSLALLLFLPFLQ